MNDDLLSSGFVGEDIPAEEERFSEIKELYVSASGYSRLYQCRRHGKLHVIKCLQPLFTVQDLYSQLLEKEFDIGYQLEHPHICRTLGWEKNETLGYCILLEYIDGITLKTFMEQGRLTRILARRIVSELCAALQYMHNKQIVHRDLKPSNILITHNGNHVKLIDFGLSDCDDYDILKIPAGTRKYIAPEQLTSHTPLDCRADLYSLGVIINEMATLLRDKPLAVLARKCTQTEPEKRYDSAQDLAEALKKKQTRGVYKYAAMILLPVVILITYLQYPFAATNGYTDGTSFLPLPTNTSVTNACHDDLLQERSRQNRQHSSAPSADSLCLRKIRRQQLDREFPTPELRRTTTYKQRLAEL